MMRALVLVGLLFAGVAGAEELPGVDAGQPVPPVTEVDAGAPVPAAALPPEPAPVPSEPSALSTFLAQTSLGGYGELTYNRTGSETPIVDLRRIVLFVGHTFGEHWRFYSEIEWEHAVTSFDDQGEAEIEQAYLDYLHADAFNVRAGLILMPVGIVNLEHEPPTFNGVDRPLVDTLIIPSTWREPGFGIWGRLGEDLRYQAYLVDGFRATGFEDETIREGHQEAQLALARSGGGVARLTYVPWNPLQLGVSGYFASANQGELPAGEGKLSLGEADAQLQWHGVEARAEFAISHITGTQYLEQDPPIGSTQYGLYVEGGYDVWRLIRTGGTASVIAYGRYQRVDTNYRVAAGLQPDDAAETQVFEGGLSWLPIPNIAFKGDVRYFDHPLVDGQNQLWIDLGIGWMY